MNTVRWQKDGQPLSGACQAHDTELLSIQTLRDDYRRFRGTGGISQENRCCDFLPAFLDSHTGIVYLSRFADGRIAPMHLLDGLPAELVVRRSATGRVMAVRSSLTAGFVRAGRFYTRTQAAQALRQNQAEVR